MPDQYFIKPTWRNRKRKHWDEEATLLILSICACFVNWLCTVILEQILEKSITFTIPGCLASLGFIQRTYDGSLDIRISISLAKLSLNCVAAWAKDNQTFVSNIIQIIQWKVSTFRVNPMCLSSSNRLWSSLVHQLFWMETLTHNVIPWLTHHLQ